MDSWVTRWLENIAMLKPLKNEQPLDERQAVFDKAKNDAERALARPLTEEEINSLWEEIFVFAKEG